MLRCWVSLALLLVLWGTRLFALEALPLHNDEGLHLTRAVEVWHGHPFWQISDGKIINHWLIALFYPQHSPVFVARVATVFIAMIGLAAGYRLSRDLFGPTAAALSAWLWIASPYLFFYERLAFSDAEAGALVVVTLLASIRLARHGRWRDAVFTGLAFALAGLFKFTAAPFALMIVMVVLAMSRVPWRRRLLNLTAVFVTVAVCFVPPLVYLTVRGRDFFTIALDWLGGAPGELVGASTSAVGATLGDNLARLWAQLTGFGVPVWTPILLLGLVLLVVQRPRLGISLLAALFVPLFIIMYFGREVLPRHFIVALPLGLLLGGAGIGGVIASRQNKGANWTATSLVVVSLLVGALPFMSAAYADPGSLVLPQIERMQFITEHSSGFGLREAVSAFPQTITRRDLPIIASMFPDGCRRANFYAGDGLAMACPQAPGQPEIAAALDEQGAVYVLVDTAPVIGLDVTTLDAQATRLAAYPRPGETDETATVVLWLLEQQTEENASATTCSSDGAVLPPYAPSNVTDFVRIQDNHFVTGDAPYLARGVNYYPSRYPWRRFLTETDSETIRQELGLLRHTGFNTLRLFLWNDALFVCPKSGAVPVTDAFLRLDAIIQEAAVHGFRLIITLNDLPDLDQHPLYINPPHIQEQTRFIVERYRDEAAILAWDLRNEGDIDYGTHVAFPARFAREDVLAWLSQTADFVRSLDPNHLITAGWLNDSESTIPAVDFVSFHHWGDADALRQRIVALYDYTDKPILLEEFGYSTFTMTPEEQSARIRQVIETAESQDLAGWLIWTAFDFPLDATCIPPACPSADNAEHHFGLWYTDYTPKPAVNIIQALLAP